MALIRIEWTDAFTGETRPPLTLAEKEMYAWVEKEKNFFSGHYLDKFVLVADRKPFGSGDTVASCLFNTVQQYGKLPSLFIIKVYRNRFGIHGGGPLISMGPSPGAWEVSYDELLYFIAGKYGQTHRSISFDLHQTLVIDRERRNKIICQRTIEVCKKYFPHISRRMGVPTNRQTENIIAWLAWSYYVDCRAGRNEISSRLLKVDKDDPASIWSLVDAHVVAHWVETHAPPTVSAGQRLDMFDSFWQRLGKLVDQRHSGVDGPTRDKLIAELWFEIGREVHEGIPGSEPNAWYVTDEQKVIVKAVVESGLVWCILSNGGQKAAEACTAAYFPVIKPWQVLTPQRLGGTSKPGEVNAALLLASVGAIMVRNAIEGSPSSDALRNACAGRKKKLRAAWNGAYRNLIADVRYRLINLTRPWRRLDQVKAGLESFLDQLQLPAALVEVIYVSPRQHLHVGNSEFHDSLQELDGEQFTCLLYQPEDATRKKEASYSEEKVR